MKSLLKIYGKYVSVTWVIFLLLLAVNMGTFCYIMVDQAFSDDTVFVDGSRLKNLTLTKGDKGEITLSADGEKMLQDMGYVFLLILNDKGDVVYSFHQPEGFKDHYTAGEIASFSRWYLHDYPVRVWRMEGGLLVAGYDKNSVWKYPLEFSMNFINHLGRYGRIFAGGNLIVILGIVVFLGYRYYMALRPLTEGMKALSLNRKVHLEQKGVTAALAEQINQTSDILENQRSALEKRDTARTEWIAGISHDIRTPLSVIIGYADELEQKDNLEKDDREKLGIIKNNSLKIRQLIEDLNLTSKLEYHMQPLRIANFYPAALLRELAAEVINEGLEEKYDLSLMVAPKLEGFIYKGDEELIKRALRNLLGNCIRHNADGCAIQLSGKKEPDGIDIEVRDNGRGIPAEVICALTEKSMQPETGERKENVKNPHIMGLRIVKQIVLAHKGIFEINEEGHCVKMRLPLEGTK